MNRKGSLQYTVAVKGFANCDDAIRSVITRAVFVINEKVVKIIQRLPLSRTCPQSQQTLVLYGEAVHQLAHEND